MTDFTTIICPHCHAAREADIPGEGGAASFYNELDGKCGECGKFDDETVDMKDKEEV